MIGSGTPVAPARFRVIGAMTSRFFRRSAPRRAGRNSGEASWPEGAVSAVAVAAGEAVRVPAVASAAAFVGLPASVGVTSVGVTSAAVAVVLMVVLPRSCSFGAGGPRWTKGRAGRFGIADGSLTVLRESDDHGCAGFLP